MSNFGAKLRFFYVGSLHTVLFCNQRLANKEKCVMMDFVRRVLEDIFVVFVRQFRFWCGFVFGRLTHYKPISSK